MTYTLLPNNVFVDLDAPERRPAPRKETPTRTEAYYPIIYTCGCEGTLKLYDAKRVGMCRTCSNVKAGQAGYAATLEKHGKQVVQRKLVDNIRKRGSWAEDLVATWLREAGVRFEDNVVFDTNPNDPHAAWYVFDFIIEGVLVIEVDGWSHALAHRQVRDEQKSKVLANVERVSTKQLTNEPEVTRQHILSLVATYCH